MINFCQVQKSQAKLAVSYEQWKCRPVFKVQCFTTLIAREICGVSRPDASMASVMGNPMGGLSNFRCLAPYRDAQANALRRQVAQQIKAMRREAALLI